ncbi:MAG: DMT family transporter [Marinobacter sp.]|uniref:EamA family transporter n=1 Tax=Marinobacter sp. TaxID=50741 RepID=UPI00396ED87F
MIGLPAVTGSNSLLAQVAIIAATVSYAFAGVYGRRFKAMAISPMITAAGQVTASALVLTPITLVVDGVPDITQSSPETWGATVGLAVLSTAVAYILYFKILESAGATNLLMVTLLIPVSAVVLGSLVLSRTLATPTPGAMLAPTFAAPAYWNRPALSRP